MPKESQSLVCFIMQGLDRYPSKKQKDRGPDDIKNQEVVFYMPK